MQGHVPRVRACGRCVATTLVALVMSCATARAATISVAAGGSLQAALNAANPGDTILVEAGATFRGKFTLPVKPNPSGQFITVRSAAPDAALPIPGQRITPAYASSLPKIRSSDSGQALTVAQGASYWRLQCLEFQANVNGAGDIIRVGSHLETNPANQPHHIVIDRVYVHGDAVIGQKNGVVAHASYFELIDSYISDIKLVGQQTQAFISYNGPGPYQIENNYLEAAGINALFGGSNPLNAAMVPSDITFVRNHVAKNVAWMTPRADGTYWLVKNLFEMKVGRTAHIEGNLFEYNWFGTSDQAGYAILLRSEDQSSGCDWCETGNVTFQNNIVRHSTAGLSLMGLDYPTGGVPRGVRMHDVVLRNNLFDDIRTDVWYVKSTKSSAKFALIDGVDRLTFDHNTMIMPVQGGVLYFVGTYACTDFVYTNNMSEHKTYGVKGGSTAVGTATLAAYTAPYTFAANVLAGGTGSAYPAGNFFPSVTTWKAGFVDYTGGDYRLLPTSPYKLRGTDGKDLGADIDAIEQAMQPPNGPPPNAVPSADDQSVNVDEDAAVAIVLSGSDPDGDTLTFALESQPSHGTLTGVAPQVTYTPVTNYNGADNFTFSVSDGKGGSDTATVSIAVVPANDPPAAVIQQVSTSEDSSIAIMLAATDPDGDIVTFALASQPSHGAVTGVAPGLTYTPAANFNGSDSFTFTVSDGNGGTDTGTVSVTVTAINDRPAAASQQVSTNEDSPIAINLAATDVDGDALIFALASPPSHGSITGVAPALTYKPAANFNGTDSFTFTVSDGHGGNDTGTVSIGIAPVNDSPVATDQQVSTIAGVPVTLTLAASDPDADVLSYAVTAAPASGTLAGTPPTVTYTPNAGFSGTDSFTWITKDPSNASATAKVTIAVAPSPLTITTTTLANGRLNRTYQQTLAASGGVQPYRWRLVSGAMPPGLTLSATGIISGVPTAVGTTTFTVEVSDAYGRAATKALAIKVVTAGKP
jgi:hypothetical protein